MFVCVYVCVCVSLCVCCSEGIKDLYSASQKQLDTEMRLRLDLERQLEAQRSLRMEKEVGRRVGGIGRGEGWEVQGVGELVMEHGQNALQLRERG